MKKLTYESVLDRLRDYQAMVIEYDACLLAYDEIQPRTQKPFSHFGTGATRNITAPQEIIAERREHTIRRLKNIMNLIEQKQDQTMELIEYADTFELQSILRLRYIHGKTIEETAELVFCSDATVKRKTEKAINSIVNNYNKNMIS
ncbi:MAG: hypothetical protein GX328_05555 [Clostridiaceae bacterium]|nr:hypothetical protein [Clostridiaceae bacterium]